MASAGSSGIEMRSIAKLNGKNWSSWRFEVTLLLEKNKLMRVVLKVDTKPAQIVTDDVITNQALIDAWDMKDIEARTVIYCNVEPDLQVLIEGCSTSAAMWDRLLLQFAQAAAANANLLLAKFFDYKYDKEHSVLSHITRLSSLAEELRNLNSPVTEQQLIMRTLHSLPPSYRPFQSSWLSVPIAEQTLLNLTSRLVTEEAMNKAFNNGEMDPADIVFFAGKSRQTSASSSSIEETAMSARGRYNSYRRGGRGYRGRGRGYRGHKHDYGNRHSGENGSNIICYSCDQSGHKAHNCPQKKDEERKQQRNDNFNKNRTSFGCVSSSLCLVAKQPHCFYADSAASNHMTDKREFFTTFKEIPPGTWKVTGIGGVELHAVGKGNINVVSTVNGEEIRGIFHDVLYVPNLKVNLFSVGTAIN
ncbi:uncharacterized protein LOC123469143 [Daphnia magna]|uniref:uncharacterized protein LOC123469143 n=1 Tax=Daphnia magna TaxID=35525 RepID=UPI001E1BCBE9|nr:uncharacterized protein LOC123469143 [Daphnia magna]